MSGVSLNFRQTPLNCSGHTRPVVFLAFSELNPEDAAPYFCIAACKDGKPMLRQGDTGDWIGTFEGHKGAVWGVDLNRNATKAATGAADFSAKVWDALSGEEELSFGHNHIVKSVNFSSDSGRLATGSNDKKLRIFDLASASTAAAAAAGLNKDDGPQEALVTFEGHTSGIKQVLFSSDDKRLISASDDKTLRFWDPASGKQIQKIEFSAPLGSIELSRCGEIITVAYGKSVGFLDANSYEKLKEVSIPNTVYSASLLKESKIFVCGGEDFKLYKYNYETGEEIESFKGHFGPVHCVRFSPDGELYASGSEDGTLRLWQTEVGKTYGLWKCVETAATEGMTPNAPEAVASG